MIPAFSIVSGSGVDYSTLYRERLIEMKVTSDACEHSDSFEVTLADTDGRLPVPVKGEIIHLKMGYRGDLVDVGSFVVDSVRGSGPPDQIMFGGKAAPFDAASGGSQNLKPFQSRRSRSFTNITLGTLVQTIAQETGLTPAIDSTLAAIQLPQVHQTSESSMNLLTRLARYYNAVMKPASGHLCFVQRGQGVSVTGQQVGGLTIDRSQTVGRYSFEFSQRTNFDRVRTRSHDTGTGITYVSETTKDGTTTAQLDAWGQGTPDSDDTGDDAIYDHPHDFPDQATAQAASASIYDQATSGSETVTLPILGNPRIVAGGMMTLTGFKSVMNQDWWVSKVEHEYTKTGFKTAISAQLPSTNTPGSKGAKELSKGIGYAADA